MIRLPEWFGRRDFRRRRSMKSRLRQVREVAADVLLFLPRRLGTAAMAFRHGLTRYWQRRRGRYALRGLPSLLTAMAAGYLMTVASSRTLASLASRYQQEAGRALQAKDYTTADICYRRLLSLHRERQEFVYGLALTCHAAGQTDRAASLMQRLAKPTEQGYAPAHLWQARQLMTQSRPTSRSLQEGIAHLERTLLAQPDNTEAHLLLSQGYLALNRPDKAEPHLAFAAERQPSYRLVLARILLAKGRQDLARIEAEKARGQFAILLKSDPDNTPVRISLAEAYAFLNDYEEAAKVLDAGLVLNTENLSLRRALAQLHVVWADSLMRSRKILLPDYLTRLERAIQLEPANTDALSRMAALASSKSPEAEKARIALQATLATGKATGVTHMILGISAYARGDNNVARQHLEQALKAMPGEGDIANNLAYVLASSDKPELDRALELINMALEKRPNHPAYRDTRGQIYAKRGQWKEALDDLQFALRSLPNDRNLHKTLAVVYDKLGNREMAAMHKKVAEAPEPPPSANGVPMH